MEIKIEGSQSYTIPLDSIDLTYLRKYVRTPHADKIPLWTKKCLDGESEYCRVQIVSQDDTDDCYSEVTFDTYNCHICNVEVPVLCFKKHNESDKHVTLKTIFQKVLERLSKQININVTNSGKDIDKDVYYCAPCSKIIKIENKLMHESSEYHMKSQRGINVVHEFYKIFEENKTYVGFKDAENEEILDENRDLSVNYFGTEIFQNDAKNNNLKVVTNKEKFNNDEAKTVCSTNDNTKKVSRTVKHLIPNDKHNEELTSEESYFKEMAKKYNLKVNLPIVDGEFIYVATPSGVKVKISQNHFHSYHYIVEGIRIYCQMCNKVELGEESNHKFSEEHARNVFIPVNEQFARTFNDYSHCLICNKVILTSRLSEHHLNNDNHVKLLSSTKLADTFCQNNKDLPNGINKENHIKRTHSEIHTIEIHANNSEENKILKCINNKEYISKINLSENDLGDHLSESGHTTRTKDATSVQKLVFCKLCNVSVPQDQMEYHNAGTPHWSNNLKQISADVADWLQAYFSKSNIKTDSDSSEIQNDTPKNENVSNQKETSKNYNLTNENVTPKNENVTNQDVTPTNDNVTKRNETHKNYDVTNQNETPKNDNLTNRNETHKNYTVTNQNDSFKNDNVTNRNEIHKNYNVTNQSDTFKNDNVTNRNEILNNYNVARTSGSNLTSNEIDTSSPFKYADSTKKKVTCIVCDIDFANVLQSITKHEGSLNHKVWLQKLLKFHTIKVNPKLSFCECCCDTNVTNIWAHIATERHTALLQLEYVIDTKALKLYNYKSNKRDNNGIMSRELYKMLLECNKIYKLRNSNFYCTLCELELSKTGNEIDHMFSAAHEEWLKVIYKSR